MENKQVLFTSVFFLILKGIIFQIYPLLIETNNYALFKCCLFCFFIYAYSRYGSRLYFRENDN